MAIIAIIIYAIAIFFYFSSIELIITFSQHILKIII